MSTNTTRIAKNTLMLYFRQILIMLVSLYTVRVVLNTLGAEDYGIYNVVGGVVTMFSFLTSSMATASQRYFSFEIGREDFEQLERVFSLSLTIYMMIAVLVLVLAETVGLWFVANKLVIPVERKDTAIWVYQFVIVSFLFIMFTTPYMASVIAHEDMSIYAYVSIIEVILKLLVVYILQMISVDKLKFYGILMLTITFINTGIYRFICTKKYKECRFRMYWNYGLFKELAGYVGWNFFGSISSVVRNQGINILLNIYFGPIVNAARAIAMQVNTAVVSFAANFTLAISPQIVKSYASGNQSQMLSQVFHATKAVTFLLLFFILPLQLELSFVLNLWLKQIPEYVLAFTRIILVDAVINSIGYSLVKASQATGKIAVDQTVEGGISILNLLIALIALIIGFSAISVQIVGIGVSATALLARIIILSRQLQFSIYQYLKNTITPIILTVITGSIIPVIFVFLYPMGIKRLFITLLISIISLGLSVFFIGFSKYERSIVLREIKKIYFILRGSKKECLQGD
jgi:O-antigen/teichoic acid export membrane protein